MFTLDMKEVWTVYRNTISSPETSQLTRMLEFCAGFLPS